MRKILEGTLKRRSDDEKSAFKENELSVIG